jgi:hypothetical protein
MTDEQFKTQMNRLITEYDNGPNKIYGPQRTAAIYKCFINYTLDDFTAIIDKVFVTERFAPMAKDLLRIAEEVRIEKHNKMRAEEKKAADKIFKEDPPIDPQARNVLVYNIRDIIRKTPIKGIKGEGA